MRTLHANWAFIAVGLNLIAGLWGIVWVRNHLPAPNVFWGVLIAGYAAVAVQVALGLAITGGSVEGAETHAFYGFVLLVAGVLSLAFRSVHARSNVLRFSAISLFIGVVGAARTIPTGFGVSI